MEIKSKDTELIIIAQETELTEIALIEIELMIQTELKEIELIHIKQQENELI